MHDLLDRKSQCFIPSWNCRRANAYSIIDARSYHNEPTVLRCETLTYYIPATFMLSMDFDSLRRQSDKQTLMRAKICQDDHGTPLPSSHCRLLRKLRLTLTLMVSWNHSSLTWMLRGGKRTKIHQKVVNNDINLLSLFGTKMVTLFGRWNKRLLLNKSLSGGGTTDTLWTLKHFNLSRLNCPPSFIYYFLLFSEMHIYKTRWRVWKHCLLPAVWSKPASWENSARG